MEHNLCSSNLALVAKKIITFSACARFGELVQCKILLIGFLMLEMSFYLTFERIDLV